MARQKMYPQPYRKQMDAFNNFSGGLNTVTSSDKLLDSELINLENIDLSERGSLKRRTGMVFMSHLQKTTTWSDIGDKKWSEITSG
jgi:hypothetical protein